MPALRESLLLAMGIESFQRMPQTMARLRLLRSSSRLNTAASDRRPAEFLIDSSGKIHGVILTDDFVLRAWLQEALAAFDAINAPSRR
jgi:hypothetical protein